MSAISIVPCDEHDCKLFKSHQIIVLSVNYYTDKSLTV